MLFLLEVPSILVYLDLWFVYAHKTHIWTHLLKLIPEKERKVYQGVYRESLERGFFCVSDKVDVSGSTFTVAFGFLYTGLMILHLVCD